MSSDEQAVRELNKKLITNNQEQDKSNTSKNKGRAKKGKNKAKELGANPLDDEEQIGQSGREMQKEKETRRG